MRSGPEKESRENTTYDAETYITFRAPVPDAPPHSGCSNQPKESAPNSNRNIMLHTVAIKAFQQTLNC